MFADSPEETRAAFRLLAMVAPQFQALDQALKTGLGVSCTKGTTADSRFDRPLEQEHVTGLDE
ncbi:MAG: hypothetical protein WA581_14985 [Candidatus Acidiferrales bacterium]